MISTLAAVIPAIYLIRYIFMKDHLEKESPKLLRRLVVLGIAATFAASITETIGQFILISIFGRESGSVLSDLLMYFLVVGLSEEGFKYLLLKRQTWNHPEFNCIFDGVVYAVVISLGFALWENIMYVWQLGFGAALVRAVTAIPGHASFGVYMGAYYGAGKRMELMGNADASKKCLQRALWIPVLLHGLYDFIASSQASIATVIFIVFIVFLFKSSLNTVNRISANDTYMQGGGM